MKILHSADWQLGCAFSGFGNKAPTLRAQRLDTLRRTLALAAEERVDAFLIAGDLFEDNQVAQSLLVETAGLLGSVPEVPVFIVPGNHDPVSGPGCIWRRPPFASTPPNVTVILEPGVFPLKSGYLIGNPLRQKLSTQDPSMRLAELAAGLPCDSIKVGMTHGALAIEGKHQPNDHPIHLEAATRAGLDYVALGHWHRWQAFDGGRVLMPGTPEPDAFDHADGRYVALVEIAGPGALPVLRQLEVGGLSWRLFELDYLNGEQAVTALRKQLEDLESEAGKTVIRVALKGQVTREGLLETRKWLDQAMTKFAAGDVVDETAMAVSATELAGLAQSNPLLARVFADLARARAFATGQRGPSDSDDDPLTYAHFQQITADLELSGTDLDESFFKTAVDVLANCLQEKHG